MGEHAGAGLLPPLLHSFWPNLPSQADPHTSRGDVSTWRGRATLRAVAASNRQFSHSFPPWGPAAGSEAGGKGQSVYRSLIPHPATRVSFCP